MQRYYLTAKHPSNRLTVPSPDDFYSPSLMDMLVIDRFTYKGRGRPKKTDYIPLREMNEKLLKAGIKYYDSIRDKAA